jgi:hypothetical protein
VDHEKKLLPMCVLAKYLREWVERRQKCLCMILFPLMPLIMEMNQPLITADLTSNDFAIRHSSIIRPLMEISVCILQYKASSPTYVIAHPGLMPTVSPHAAFIQ